MQTSAFDDHQSTFLSHNLRQGLDYHYPRHIGLKIPSLLRKHRDIVLDKSSFSQMSRLSSISRQSPNESCPIPVKQSRKVFTNSLSKTHLENIRNSLEHRLEIAKSQGNQELIGLLEKESQYLLTF
ncbi:MAG TPA: hypothetical protein DCF68_23285 [Cyanothece sp. UBA12306]|nr:hypothetical protein [Cyanothece sp. UBA12306]